MQSKQAAGLDTPAMLPIFGSVYSIICMVLLPWVSLPFLKYSRLPVTYSLWQLGGLEENINKSIALGGKLKMTAFDDRQLYMILTVGKIFLFAALLISVIVLISAILMGCLKIKAVTVGRFAFVMSAMLPAVMFAAVAFLNIIINVNAGRENNFINLTIHSYVQMTSWPYAQMVISVLLFGFLKKLLDTKADEPLMYTGRRKKEDVHIGRRTKTAFLLICAAIPSMIFFGIFFLNDRSPLFIALCIIGLSMLPFCMIFEDRRPQARELLLIAVMAAIAAVGGLHFLCCLSLSL